ncbi:uncharacterized protein LOC133184564 [Saccostrea echinata]|uniref:uncharacterized protein LOC133184564 n=1 Tax=Saccostrea echinata TaxID=191078 RepID=UPI002A7EDAFE|nr:uncharacterized protein LOC133184564 [Saccostrea echinata]
MASYGLSLLVTWIVAYSSFIQLEAAPSSCLDNFFMDCSLLQPEMCSHDCVANELCPGFCNKCRRKCYKCDAVDRPEDCHNTTVCEADQVCIVTQTFTESLEEKFRLGCVDKSICMSLYGSVQSKRSISFDGGCCDHNYCNKHDPDVTTIYPMTERVTTPAASPLELCQDIDTKFCAHGGRKECHMSCFEKMCPVTCGKCLDCRSCSVVDNTEDCNITKTCNQSEVCIAIETRDTQTHRKVKLGCVSKSTCDHYNFTVRETPDTSRISHVDGYCCNTTNCNSKPLPSPESTTIATTSTTTPSPEPNPRCPHQIHGCPPHFDKILNSCYQFYHTKDTHDHANRYCHGSCTRPVIISSTDEARAITQHILQNHLPGPYWTDGIQHGSHLVWKSTQMEVMSSLINPHMLQYNHTKQCLQFGKETHDQFSPNGHFYLDRKPCGENFYTICEYALK